LLYFIISLRLKNIFPLKEDTRCDNYYIQANYLWIDVMKYYVIIYQSQNKSNSLNEKSSKNGSARNVLNENLSHLFRKVYLFSTQKERFC